MQINSPLHMAFTLVRNTAGKCSVSGPIHCITSWFLLLVVSDTEHKDGEQEGQVDAVFPSAVTFTSYTSFSVKCWISSCVWQHLKLADDVLDFDACCLCSQQVSLGCDPKNLGHEAYWMWSGCKCGWDAKEGFARANTETINECAPEGRSDRKICVSFEDPGQSGCIHWSWQM